MLVVADTSVLINLARIGRAPLLRQLFGAVAAPAAVREEFARLASVSRRFRGVEWPTWVEVHGPTPLPDTLLSFPRRLHAGEREAISLALALRADLLLVDEDAGRAAAAAHGLPITGIAGVLLRAKRSGLEPEVAAVLDLLEDDAGFWIGSAFRREVLLLAGEPSEA